MVGTNGSGSRGGKKGWRGRGRGGVWGGNGVVWCERGRGCSCGSVCSGRSGERYDMAVVVVAYEVTLRMVRDCMFAYLFVAQNGLLFVMSRLAVVTDGQATLRRWRM